MPVICKMRGALLLVTALVTEMFGMISLKAHSHSSELVGKAAIYLCLIWSVYFLGRANDYFQSFWIILACNLTITLTVTICGLYMFNEPFTWLRFTGLFMIVTGVALLSFFSDDLISLRSDIDDGSTC